MLFWKNDPQILIKNGFPDMANLKSWISASRLRTLPLSISGTVVGSSYAYFFGYFDWLIFSLLILTTLSFQILSNLANDYGDGVKGTDNDSRLGPKRAIQSGTISPKQMRKAVVFNTLISALLTITLICVSLGKQQLFSALIFLILGGLSIYAAITYTVGKSAYGYRALGDIMVFLFFGLVSVFGTFFLFAKQIDFRLVFPASTIGLLSAAVLNLNNMRDLDSDLKSNKFTLAGLLGIRKAKLYHYCIILLALLSMIVFQIMMMFSKLMFISWMAFIPLLFHLKAVYQINNPKHFDPHLKRVALSTFVLSLLFSIALILEHCFLMN